MDMDNTLIRDIKDTDPDMYMDLDARYARRQRILHLT
jgi:hypothetical protein